MERLNLNCPKCGRFSKTLIKENRRSEWCFIFHCEKCGVKYGRIVGYAADVDGEMQSYVSVIMKNSKTWNDLISQKPGWGDLISQKPKIELNITGKQMKKIIQVYNANGMGDGDSESMTFKFDEKSNLISAKKTFYRNEQWSLSVPLIGTTSSKR